MLDSIRGLLSPNALPMEALRAGAAYLRRNPAELFTVVRGAAGFKVVVPIDALRWVLGKVVRGKRAPRELTLGTSPPSLHIGALVEVMGNGLRAGADITIDELTVSTTALRVDLRISNLVLQAENPASPMAQMVKAIDVTKVANLLSFIPKRPAALVEADGNRIVLDLLRVEKLAANPTLRRFWRLRRRSSHRLRSPPTPTISSSPCIRVWRVWRRRWRLYFKFSFRKPTIRFHKRSATTGSATMCVRPGSARSSLCGRF